MPTVNRRIVALWVAVLLWLLLPPSLHMAQEQPDASAAPAALLDHARRPCHLCYNL